MHATGELAVQAPALHASFVVQTLPSSHGVPFGAATFRHVPAFAPALSGWHWFTWQGVELVPQEDTVQHTSSTHVSPALQSDVVLQGAPGPQVVMDGPVVLIG